MTRIEVLTAVILAAASAYNVEPTSIVVHEVIGDTDRTLGPRLPMLVTISSSGNVQHVRPGARVVVLHSQDARELNLQLAVLLEREVGFIVIPNANPAEEEQQAQPRASSVWTGDGWKSVASLRSRTLREVITVDGDHGTAVIFPAGILLPSSIRIPAPDHDLPHTTWAGLVEHRAVWLGLVTPARFAELLAGPVVSEVSAPATSTAVDVQPETTETPVEDQPVVEPVPVEALAEPATSRRSRRRSSTGNA